MKKKGLIIATIVMVLVLAVSLTTATYAWFTQSATSSIGNIALSVDAGSDVKIGLTPSGSYEDGAGIGDFVSGDLTFNASNTPKWTGDFGMAGIVNTNLSLNAIQLATGTASAVSAGATIDAANAQLTNSTFVKAGASNDTGSIKTDTIVAALENTDYLHFTLGLNPSKESSVAGTSVIDTYTLHVTIAATDDRAQLGMTAALHVLFKVNDEDNWVNIDLGGNQSYSALKTTARTFGSPASDNASVVVTGYTAATTLATITGSTDTTAIPAGSTNIAITIGEADTAMLTSRVDQIEMYIYYVGSDSDCNNKALVGSEATAYFTIRNTEVA